MKNTSTYVWILFFFSCLYACDAFRAKIESSSREIDMERLPKIPCIKYGDTEYLKSSKIIKLETVDENLIGEISQIELYDNKLYILDKSVFASNLFVFDSGGNFLSKIGTRGEGPEEYVDISSFFIDEKEGTINLIDGSASTLLQYDRKGAFLKKIRYNNPHLNLIARAKVVGDSLFCYSGTNWEGNNMFLLINKNDFSIIKEVRKYPGQYTNRFVITFCMNPFTCIDGEFHFGALFTDTIFALKNDTIVPYLIAKNKKNMASSELVEELEKDEYNYGRTLNRIVKNNVYNSGTFNYFENKRYILWDFAGGEQEGRCAILWDKREKEGVYITDYMRSSAPDLSSFISTSENTVIQVWNNKTIQIFRDEIEGKKRKATDYPSELMELIRDYDTEDDNPLLILHEFKED